MPNDDGEGVGMVLAESRAGRPYVAAFCGTRRAAACGVRIGSWCGVRCALRSCCLDWDFPMGHVCSCNGILRALRTDAGRILAVNGKAVMRCARAVPESGCPPHTSSCPRSLHGSALAYSAVLCCATSLARSVVRWSCCCCCCCCCCGHAIASMTDFRNTEWQL
eukprot:COSAG01_NODE_1013_length_12138_cov_7.073926_6_plen_164_part_00